MNKKHVLSMVALMIVMMLMLCSCAASTDDVEKVDNEEVNSVSQEEPEADEGVGDTIDADIVGANDAIGENVDDEVDPAEQVVSEAYIAEPENKNIDLIIFAGQSNMSGCGGDAALAPKVTEGAGFEFRAISDPSQLYTIAEPFGVNENNLDGLCEKPTGKKGSLVSAFVNEYYKLTGTPVVAISASRGEMAVSQFLEPGVVNDITNRFTLAQKYLIDNGYTIRNMYMVWLQGESDGIKRTQADIYRTQMDDFIRPLFMEGLQKVFFITPGRTIQQKDIYNEIINAQKNMCRDSGYYSLASTILTGVSTSYMTDIYHYNQHVLNLVGKDAADAVAYYTNNKQPKIIFDYSSFNEYVPAGQEFQERDPNMVIDLANIDINEEY